MTPDKNAVLKHIGWVVRVARYKDWLCPEEGTYPEVLFESSFSRLRKDAIESYVRCTDKPWKAREKSRITAVKVYEVIQ